MRERQKGYSWKCLDIVKIWENNIGKIVFKYDKITTVHTMELFQILLKLDIAKNCVPVQAMSV